MTIVGPSPDGIEIARRHENGTSNGVTRVSRACSLSGSARESFRLLALNLRSMLNVRPDKAVAVMSARDGDGRTMVATHLAEAIAEYDTTLLARAVAMEPEVKRFVQAFPNGNRSTFGDGSKHEWRVLRPGVELAELHPQPDIAKLVGAPMSDLRTVANAASHAGVYSIIDTPAATSTSDAFLIASQVGQVVYVVRAQSQDMDIHREVRRHLSRLRVKVLGVIVNSH